MADSTQDPAPVPWRKAVMISGVGMIVGIAAFVLFCHSLGLNFRDQGWGESEASWETNRVELGISFAGFAVATVLFWLGFFHATQSRHGS